RLDLEPLHRPAPRHHPAPLARHHPHPERAEARELPGGAVDPARWTDLARDRSRCIRCSRMARTTEYSDGIWLKREDEHELGAFKWRGAQAVIEQLRPTVVVTASTGNHGAATAWAAKRAGVRAVVFVPQQASAAKVALIQAQGAELYRVGVDMDEAKAAARAYAAEHDAYFFE